MKFELSRPALLGMTGVLLALMALACGPRPDSPAPETGPPDEVKKAEPGHSDPAPPPVDPELLAEGKKAWRSCAACHCATDPRIEEDEDWVLLNEKTTCIDGGYPAPRLRSSILAYLRHPDTLRPDLVDARYTPGKGKTSGTVIVPRTAGSAFLKADRESIRKGSPSRVRLVWGKSEKGKTLAAPAGEFTVINYWLYRCDEKNPEGRWMATGTNVDGCAVLYIEPETDAVFELGTVIYGEFCADRKEGKVHLSFALQDMGGNRMSLSRNGRIVMPRYGILDKDGKTLGEGVFDVI